jgi:hypothetical protein
MFLPQWQRPSFTYIQNHRQNETKHSTQNYSNNKVLTTHNE